MPCPLCNHTMQNLGVATSGSRTFWCPRCGTLKTEHGDFTESESPRWTRLMATGNEFQVRREYAACVWPAVADDECSTCGGSGGGDEPHIKCSACDGTGRRK